MYTENVSTVKYISSAMGCKGILLHQLHVAVAYGDGKATTRCNHKSIYEDCKDVLWSLETPTRVGRIDLETLLLKPTKIVRTSIS